MSIKKQSNTNENPLFGGPIFLKIPKIKFAALDSFGIEYSCNIRWVVSKVVDCDDFEVDLGLSRVCHYFQRRFPRITVSQIEVRNTVLPRPAKTGQEIR